jgi:hypothetical protein
MSAKKTRVIDQRRPQFCWASNDAVDALQEALKGEELAKALGLYLALCRMASEKYDGEHRGFEGFKLDIARRSGISDRRLSPYVDKLVSLNVLQVELGGGSLPNTWILIDPPLRLIPGATVAPGDSVAPGDTVTPPTQWHRHSGTGSSNNEQQKRSEGDVKTSPSSLEERALRLCKFLTEAAGGDPAQKRYSEKQRSDAAYLLKHQDPKTIKAVVEWAHTRTFWASKVVKPTSLRERWDELFADYRAARKAKAPVPDNELARKAERAAA